jgi:hypothetical protein
MGCISNHLNSYSHFTDLANNLAMFVEATMALKSITLKMKLDLHNDVTNQVLYYRVQKGSEKVLRQFDVL